MITETAAETPVLRPSRRPLRFMAPLVVAETLVVVALAFGRGLGFERKIVGLLVLALPIFLIMLALVWRPWRYVLTMMFGRTEVGRDGLVNRTMAGSTRIGWRDVAYLDVRRSLFGRKLHAVLKKRRRRVALAAPRDGLLVPAAEFDAALAALERSAADFEVPVRTRPRLSRRTGWTTLCVTTALLVGSAGFLTRPWLDDWWPGRAAVVRPPHACAIPGVAGLVPGLHETDNHYSRAAQESSCTWAPSAARRGGDPRLEVHLSWYGRGFSRDSNRQAHDAFLDRQDGDPYRPVPGVGDEAAEHYYPPDSSGVWGNLLVRRANVFVRVDYGARQPSEQVTTTAEQIARTVVARLKAS
jgi:hypothetical protein